MPGNGDFQDPNLIRPARPAPNMLPPLPAPDPGPWPGYNPPPMTPVTVPPLSEPSRRK